MTYEKYKIDLKASMALYHRNRKHIEKKQCYVNVYRTYFGIPLRTASALRIAYGYVSLGDSFPNMYARHAFFLDETNNVIDPTFGLFPDKTLREYMVFYIFDSAQEYVDAIERENCMPSLCAYLRKYEHEFLKNAPLDCVFMG